MKTLLLSILTLIMTHSETTKEELSNHLKTNLTIDYIIKYPPTYEKKKSTRNYPLIIALHGHGSNEKDLISLSNHLQEDLIWVSGRGPHTLAVNSYDWYELPPNPQKIAEILTNINIFIEELKTTYPIDPSNIFLMGFSQGSMISLSYVMAFPNNISGVIAQSGAIPSNIGLETDENGLKNKPILITHGTEDNMMPITRGRQTQNQLIKLGANVTYKEFQMGHSINNQSISAVNEWLQIELNN